jgi:hypothetical protein
MIALSNDSITKQNLKEGCGDWQTVFAIGAAHKNKLYFVAFRANSFFYKSGFASRG